MRRTLTTLALGTMAAASVAMATPAGAASGPAVAAPVAAPAAVSAPVAPKATTAWSEWKSWTLQPGVAGVAVKGKTRWRTVDGRRQVDIRANVRDTDLNNSKNACAQGISYLIPVGSRTGEVCGGGDGEDFEAGGYGIQKVMMRECVDNALSFEKCSDYKQVYPI